MMMTTTTHLTLRGVVVCGATGMRTTDVQAVTCRQCREATDPQTRWVWGLRTRRYGVWAGRPAGTPRDPARCAQEIRSRHVGDVGRQCTRRRGLGPGGEFCAQHARAAERLGVDPD